MSLGLDRAALKANPGYIIELFGPFDGEEEIVVWAFSFCSRYDVSGINQLLDSGIFYDKLIFRIWSSKFYDIHASFRGAA